MLHENTFAVSLCCTKPLLCALFKTQMWAAALVHAHAAQLLVDSDANRFLVFRVLSRVSVRLVENSLVHGAPTASVPCT